METRNQPVFTRVPVAGQSLHRWLVGIPVILYVGTLAFFVLYAVEHDPMWLRDAFLANLGAVVAAAIVAVPGLLDFMQIPKGARARTIGLRHASFMVVVLGLFATNLGVHFRVMTAALKGSIALHRGFDPTTALALTGSGVVLALCGGALGLALAHRFHVGDVPLDTSSAPPTMKPRPH